MRVRPLGRSAQCGGQVVIVGSSLKGGGGRSSMVTEEGFRSDVGKWSGALVYALPGLGEDGVDDLWLAVYLAGAVFEEEESSARWVAKAAVYACEAFGGVLVVFATSGTGLRDGLTKGMSV